MVTAPTLDDVGVPPALQRSRSGEPKSFESFDELTADLARARRAVEEWADAYPDIQSGLVLTGPAGVGKTHLAVSALRRVLVDRQIAIRARFIYPPELVQRLVGSGWREEEAILAPIRAAEILVLDQLGAGQMQEWVLEKLLYLLTLRYNQGGLLLATTAYPLAPSAEDQISLTERITRRGVSMLQETCRFVDIVGHDYRVTVLSHSA